MCDFRTCPVLPFYQNHLFQTHGAISQFPIISIFSTRRVVFWNKSHVQQHYTAKQGRLFDESSS